MTGKLADTVMSVRNGEQLARKYQPIVFNPSTPAQVAQRAKMKALSQLSAILAPAIAIPRVGAVSSRNLFTKVNFPNVTYSENTASINIPLVQLTKSVVGLPPVAAVNTAGVISVYLGVPPQGIDRVVYVALVREADETLRYGGSAVVSAPGADGIFPGEISIGATLDSFILAYGIRDNTDAARATFGNLESPAASEVASLIVTRTLTESDITLTETRGVSVTLATQQSNAAPSSTRKSK